jgi:hypothetical protein
MSSYIEKVLWTLLKSSFSKKSFCYLLISLVTLIIRSHIDGIMAYLLTTPFEFINFFIRIFVSSFLIIKSKYIYDVVQRYEPEFYNLVRYLINNYNEKNFKRWKRNINLSICIYIYFATFLINISNESIRQIIIEYIICYFLIESYENYINGRLQILRTKEFECNMYDTQIIENLIDTNDNYDPVLFDIKKS